jgi:hypothetical protein
MNKASLSPDVIIRSFQKNQNTQGSNTKGINRKKKRRMRQIPTHLRASPCEIYHRRHGSGIHELMSFLTRSFEKRGRRTRKKQETKKV